LWRNLQLKAFRSDAYELLAGLIGLLLL